MLRLSAAGRLGSGRQWLSWIHLDDIVCLLLHALDAAPSGFLEGVAPQPATNRQSTRALCHALGTLENLPVPALAIQALFGERADIVVGSIRIEPQATRASGFDFRFETVEQVLDDLLAPLRGGVHLRIWEQWLPHAAQAVWPFFFEAHNLEDITPPFLAFRARESRTASWPRGRRAAAGLEGLELAELTPGMLFSPDSTGSRRFARSTLCLDIRVNPRFIDIQPTSGAARPWLLLAAQPRAKFF